MPHRFLNNGSRISSTLLLLVLLTGCSNDALLDIEGEKWQLEEVASGRSLGLHSSLTITSDGTVHIAYHDAIRYRLYYANRVAPSVWSTARVDTPGWVGNSVVLHADASDRLHMLYQDRVVGSIRHARFDGTDWTSDYIGPADSKGEFVELVDEAGELYLVELVTQPELPKFTYWNTSASNWNYIDDEYYLGDPIDVRTSFGFSLKDQIPSIAILRLTRTDPLIVSGRKWLDGFEIRVYQYQGSWSDSVYAEVHGLWNQLGRDPIKNRCPKAVALIHDDDDTLHLIYRDMEGILLDLAGGTIDTGVANGFLRCRKGPGGELWLLYQVGNGLALAQRPAGGSWSSRVGLISNVNPDGRWDLHIDTDGTPHVSFYSRNHESLWYGRWDGVP